MSRANFLATAPKETCELSVCHVCGHLYGMTLFRETLLKQRCRCWPEQEDRWPAFDFNEFATLCHGCGIEALQSGSRWSVWFCDPCKSIVCSLNDLCHAYVIPIGRHSIQGAPWQRTATLHAGQLDVEAFVDTLQNIFQRMQQLQEQARLTVIENCRQGGSASHDPTLDEYQLVCKQNVLLRSIRMRQLLERFDVPASIARQVATDLGN